MSNLRGNNDDGASGICGWRWSYWIRSGYNQRSRVEPQIGHWKGVIGPKLKARSYANQKTEVRIGAGLPGPFVGSASRGESGLVIVLARKLCQKPQGIAI